MTAREVAKWHGKACVVELVGHGTHLCAELKRDSVLPHLWRIYNSRGECLMVYAQEIRSIKARRK